MLKLKLFFFVLLMVLLHSKCKERDFDVYHRSCAVKSLHKCCQVNCSITHRNSSLPQLNYFLTTKMNFTNRYANIAISVKRPNGKPFIVFSSPRLSMCQMALGVGSVPLIQNFFGNMRKQGTFSKGCPILAGTYSIRNFTVDSSIFPDYVGNWTFMTSMTAYIVRPDGKQINTDTIKYGGEIIRKGDTKFNGKWKPRGRR